MATHACQWSLRINAQSSITSTRHVLVKARACYRLTDLTACAPLTQRFPSCVPPSGQTSSAAHGNPAAEQPSGAHVPAQLHHAQHVLQQHFTDLQDVLYGTAQQT